MSKPISRRILLALGSTTAMASAAHSLKKKGGLLFGDGSSPSIELSSLSQRRPRFSVREDNPRSGNPLNAKPAGPETSSWPSRASTPPPSIPSFAHDYWSFLVANPLRHITPEEIIRPHLKQRSGVPSGIPPKNYWDRILPTLHVADEMRARLGVPLQRISSAYRSPAYNARCPGAARRSQHTMNRALDLVFSCPSWSAYKVALQLRKEGLFAGGIGRYSSFVHIDTRGTNTTWMR